MKSDYKVECISDEAAFQELKKTWNTLAEETNPENVFLRHEWFDAAWQWRRVDSRLHILVVQHNGLTVGIAPLINSREVRRKIPLRTLKFLAVPDTQSCDILTSSSEHQRVLEVLIKWLQQEHKRWDQLVLDRLPQGTSTVKCVLDITARSRNSARITDRAANPYIDLTTTWTEFYAQRSRRLKKGNNLIANKLKKAIDEIHIYNFNRDGPGNPQLKELITTLGEISASSWKKETGVSLDQAGPHAFLIRLIELAHAKNWLSVWLLSLDGKNTAMELQLSYKGHIHALRADFDEQYGELSPGSYLNWKILERLFEQKHERYWMGPGHNTYKLRWTDKYEEIEQLVLRSKTLPARLIDLLEYSIIPRLKKIVRFFQNRR